MPSPVGHVIAGVTAGWLVAGAPLVAPKFWQKEKIRQKVAGTFPGRCQPPLRRLRGRRRCLAPWAHAPTSTFCLARTAGRRTASRPRSSSASLLALWYLDRHSGRRGAAPPHLRRRVLRCLRFAPVARLARPRLVAAYRHHGVLACEPRLLRVRPPRVHADLATLLSWRDVRHGERPRRSKRADDSDPAVDPRRHVPSTTRRS